MRFRRKSYGAPTEADLKHLRKLKHLEHSEIAIAQAMYLCASRRICPPEWLVVEAALTMIELLKHEKSAARGRTANPLVRFKHACWDMQRYEAVVEVQNGRKVARYYDRELKADPTLATKQFRRLHKERKAFLRDDNFECAAALLNGTSAEASPSAIRDSYRRVKRARADGSDMTRTHFDLDFLSKLGVRDFRAEKGVEKPSLF